VTTTDGDAVRRALLVLWRAHRDNTAALVADVRRGIDEPTADAREQARRAAHRLAGSLGTFGMPDGTALARRLERAFDPDRPAPPAAVLVPLVTALTAVIERFDDATPAGGEPRTETPRRGRRVAVVGFAEPFAASLRAEIATRGATPLDAPDVDTVLQMSTDAPVDAVVVDIDRVDLELADERPWPSEAPPAVAVSAGRRLADRVAATRRNARRYVQRPTTPSGIVTSVESMWTPPRRTATVVAVDDDQMILDTLRVLLSGDDIHLVAVDDQEQFWRALHEHHPDVVVLDVDMPDISGIELCRVLRTDDQWLQTGVIFLTAHRDAATWHAVFEAGADDLVVKPIIGPELRARIASRIERPELHRRLAEADGLTGLTNRAATQRITERMIDAARAAGRPLSVALVDLDHFKQVNDVHGHHTGDEVLRRFASLAQDARPSLAGRWGGEEFLLVYDDVPAAAASREVEALLAALRVEEFAAADGGTFRCSFSAGVAEWTGGTGLAGVVQRADDALYRAKDAGRSRVVVADA
jgi:diguanylate cyclase (GGDEF)-like protein